VVRTFGLIKIMKHRQNFDEGAIAQFYTTLHMDTNLVDITMKWMTKNQLLTAKWSKFADLLGYPILPGKGANGWRCHFNKASEPEVLEPLYIEGWGVCGQTNHLSRSMISCARSTRTPLLPRLATLIRFMLSRLTSCTRLTVTMIQIRSLMS